MQQCDGNDITFDRTLADCDVCAVGKTTNWLTSRRPKALKLRSLQVCEQNPLPGLQLDPDYLFRSKDEALVSLQAYVTSMVIPFSNRLVRFRADKGGKYNGGAFQA